MHNLNIKPSTQKQEKVIQSFLVKSKHSSSFISKMLVLFVLMAQGWWQDSGPIKLFLEQIGPWIRRSHVNEKWCCECSTMTRIKRFCESIKTYLKFCKVGMLSIIERKLRDEEIEVCKLLIAILISRLQNKMSAQKWSFSEIYIKKWSDSEFSHLSCIWTKNVHYFKSSFYWTVYLIVLGMLGMNW